MLTIIIKEEFITLRSGEDMKVFGEGFEGLEIM